MKKQQLNIFNASNVCKCKKNFKVKILTEDFDHGMFEGHFIYVHCKKCECVYLEKVPTWANISKIYPLSYEAYTGKSFGHLGNFARSIAAKFKAKRIRRKVSQFKSAIEFGCGSKPLITEMQNIISNITLCDIKIRNNLRNFNNIEGNVELEIRKIKKKFDLIVFNQLIEHLIDPEKFLIHCYRILNKGGIVYFETPNISSLDAKIFLSSGCWGGLHAPRHFKIFGEDSIRKISILKKFDSVDISYLYNPFILNNTFKNILKKNGNFRVAQYLSLANPFVIGFYFLVDSLLLLITKKTGNMAILLKK